MIVKVETLTSMDEFKAVNPDTLDRKLIALEKMIRSHTNNNFQNRSVRFKSHSVDNKLFGASPFLKIGDTVQISQSKVNDGLYTIKEVTDDSISVDKELFNVQCNLVTKVEYPDDIQEGVINLMLWEIENRKKVGVKSESISRHSVTYFDLDKNNQVKGYPASLLGFLEPYMRARF